MSQTGELTLYKDELPDTILTQTLENGGIGKENLTCEIINAKVVDPGIFRSKYTSYSLKTLPKAWVAERKYDWFLDLRDTFLKMYPGYIIPPLPRKPEKKLEPSDVEKRRQCLEFFLNDVLKHPVLRTSSLLFLFLSIPSEKEYESKRKVYAKLPLPRDVTEIRTISGNARVSYDTPLKQYCSALGNGNGKLKELQKE